MPLEIARVTRSALRLTTNAFAELVWPTRCVGCNLPGELLCADCRRTLPWICQRWACPMCGAPFGWLVCTQCGRAMLQERWPVHATICALPFEGVAAAIPPMLKDAHELRLAAVMAAAMAGALEEAAAWQALDGQARVNLHEIDALCFVPATAQAYARRGFDHMELVAAALSEILDIPLRDVLVRQSARDQRELGREGRLRNLSNSMDLVDDVAGARMLLVDDVITTGASVTEAARTLLAHGARRVTACAFARVW